MTLQTWLKNRWLTKHRPSPEEVADLLAIVDRDLEDASVDQLSPDWRLSIAYNAALARTIERYRPDDSFEVVTESLEWRPDHDASPLVIDLPTYFDRVHGIV